MSHVTYLEEAFDKPYKFRRKKLYTGFYTYTFVADDKSEIDVLFREHELYHGSSTWSVNFERNQRMDVTGEGDAMRIFATVIDILKDFVKKDKPEELLFSAEKPEWLRDKRNGKLGSREKLYKKLVQRYAGPMGYKFTTQTDNSATDFRLVAK